VRLDAVAATQDGFELSRIDLEQRREGDVMGASQSGAKSKLRLLRVLRDEAMELVAASWASGQSACVLATLDGGRTVAALRTEQGRWAACNAFHEHASATHHDAERALKKLLGRGRSGYVGSISLDEKKPAQS